MPYTRFRRGGFFKSIFKGVKKAVAVVTKVPVLGAVAKTVVGSLPILGQVQTAVSVFKKKTPVGVAASPVGGISPPQEGMVMPHSRAPRKRRAKRAKRAKTTKRAKKAKRTGGGSAKQRAARARFAAAARKGRIKKGSRL